MEYKDLFKKSDICDLYKLAIDYDHKANNVFFNVESMAKITEIIMLVHKNSSQLRMKMIKAKQSYMCDNDLSNDIITECISKFDKKHNLFLVGGDKKKLSAILDNNPSVKWITRKEYLSLMNVQ